MSEPNAPVAALIAEVDAAINNLQYETQRIDVTDPDAARYLGALSVDFSSLRKAVAQLASFVEQQASAAQGEVTKVQRWTVFVDSPPDLSGGWLAECESPDGQWVRYKDYARELQAARRDAGRLDWLEAHLPNVSPAVTPQSGPWVHVGINESLRNAIDAARAASAGGA